MKNIINAFLFCLLLLGVSCIDHKKQEMEETEAAIAVIDSVETEVEDIVHEIEDQAEELEDALEELDEETDEEETEI